MPLRALSGPGESAGIAYQTTMDVTTPNSTPQHTEPLELLLLRPEQVAHLLGVSADGVKYLHRTGRLRGVVISRKLRFPRRVVEKYVQELEQEVMR